MRKSLIENEEGTFNRKVNRWNTVHRSYIHDLLGGVVLAMHWNMDSPEMTCGSR